MLLASAKFTTYLVNQQIAHKILALELLTLLLEKHTSDTSEVATGFIMERGSFLQDIYMPPMIAWYIWALPGILHEGKIDKRLEIMVEGLLAICKAQL